MHREILPTWKGAIPRQKRKVLNWYGLARGTSCMFMVENLSWRPIINL